MHTLNILHFTSGQDGGIGRYACFFTQPKKEQQQIQKQKATRNARKSVWKSNNQGVNEETFIQTGRRGRDGQPVQKGHMARWQLEDQEVPHLHADKPGGTTGERDRLNNPGIQPREIKPQNL